MKDIVRRLWREDISQDLVEYALLAGFIGLASVGGFIAVQNTIASSYGKWDANQQGLWQPPNPVSSGS